MIEPPAHLAHMLVLCPACDFVWSAATLPMDVTTIANLMKNARCPKCDAGSAKLCLPFDEERVGLWQRENR